jgi:hypothetical protein
VTQFVRNVRYAKVHQIKNFHYFKIDNLVFGEMKILVRRAGMIRLQAGRPRNLGSIPGKCERVFFTASRLSLGLTQYPVQWIPEVLSSEINRARRETGQSLPVCAQFKNAWSLSSIPSSSWHGA